MLLRNGKNTSSLDVQIEDISTENGYLKKLLDNQNDYIRYLYEENIVLRVIAIRSDPHAIVEEAWRDITGQSDTNVKMPQNKWDRFRMQFGVLDLDYQTFKRSYDLIKKALENPWGSKFDR